MKKSFIICILAAIMMSGCNGEEEGVQSQISEVVVEENYYEEEEMVYEQEGSDELKAKESIFLYPSRISEFSEGMAWVETVNEENGEKMFVLINEEGKAKCIETGKILYVSSCQDGLVYLRKQDSEENIISKVIDKDGQLVFESKDIENCTILAYGDNMFIVGKYVSGFDVSEKQIGVVNREGEWLQPLSTDKFIIDGECVIDGITTGEENCLKYLGDGVFVAISEIFDFAFYNAVDNINFNLHGYWNFMGDYYEGEILIMNTRIDSNYDSGVYCLDKKGKMTMISDAISEYMNEYHIGEYSDGLWYYEGCFYNTKGEKIVDISQYNSQIEKAEYKYPIFKNGYSIIVLQGADGKTYYTVIDMKGQFMFEPRILELAYFKENGGAIYKWDKTSPGELKDLIFNIYENKKWIYYDVNGEKVLEINKEIEDNETLMSAFDNETALLKCREGLFYIGKDGEVRLEMIEIPKKLLEN